MLAFEQINSILDFMGLLRASANTNPWTHYIKNVLITLPMLVLLSCLCAFFIANLGDLVEATDVFYVIASTLLCISQYWFLVGQKISLCSVLTNLQHLVDQSEFCHYFYLFRQALRVWLVTWLYAYLRRVRESSK